MKTIDKSKKYEKWRQSLEDVHYDLKLITECHAEEGDIAIICDTFLKLPKNVF